MWMFSILPEPPAASRDLRISSVFYSDAKEVGAKPNLKALTYSYERAHSWRHIGAQILNASGWRPDCAQAQDTNIERILPPRPSEGAPLKSPRAGVLDMGDPKLCHLIDVLDLTEPTGVVVHASAFFQGGCGASCACIRMMDDPPETQRWIMGVDSVSSGPRSMSLRVRYYMHCASWTPAVTDCGLPKEPSRTLRPGQATREFMPPLLHGSEPEQ